MLLSKLKFSLINVSVLPNMNSIAVKLVLPILTRILFTNNQLTTVSNLRSPLNDELTISFSFVILEHAFKIVDRLWPLLMWYCIFRLINWGDRSISLLLIIHEWTLVKKVIKIKISWRIMFSTVFKSTYVFLTILLIESNLWRSLRPRIIVLIALWQDIKKFDDPKMVVDFLIGQLIPSSKVMSSLNIS